MIILSVALTHLDDKENARNAYEEAVRLSEVNSCLTVLRCCERELLIA